MHQLVEQNVPDVAGENSEIERPPWWEQPFLQALAACGAIGEAAKATGIDRKTPQRRQKSNPGFAAQMRAAIQDSADTILVTMRRRLIDGYDRPVMHKGKLIWVWVDHEGKIIPTPAAKKRAAATAQGCKQVMLTERRYHDGVALGLLKCLRFDARQARRLARLKAKEDQVTGVTVINQNTNVNGPLSTKDLFEEMKDYLPVFEKLARERALEAQLAEASKEGELADEGESPDSELH
jgi:hypothetical protein